MDCGCFRSRHATSSAALWKLNAVSRNAAILIQPNRPGFDRLAAHVDDGKPQALLGEEVALRNIAQALAPSGSGSAVGKIVIYDAPRALRLSLSSSFRACIRPYNCPIAAPATARTPHVVHHERRSAMLQPISVIKGFAMRASDGQVGTVVDFLFDDASWKCVGWSSIAGRG